ncbi:MAG: DUF5041 domain-containing protein [Bacteroidota bacterium]|jgi:hypothetical protein
MNYRKKMYFVLLIFFFAYQNTYSQFNKRFQDISNKDVIEALQFAGIDIFKIPLDSIKQNYGFSIIADEYVTKDSIIFSDTLLSYFTVYGKYNEKMKAEDAFIDHFRFVSKILNNSYEKIFLLISTNSVETWREMTIDKKYARKHYWVRFAKQPQVIGQKIPLLFYGSEWDNIINGKKVPRYCSREELTKELNDPTIKFIPHFFIISYELNTLP